MFELQQLKSSVFFFSYPIFQVQQPLLQYEKPKFNNI